MGQLARGAGAERERGCVVVGTSISLDLRRFSLAKRWGGGVRGEEGCASRHGEARTPFCRPPFRDGARAPLELAEYP